MQGLPSSQAAAAPGRHEPKAQASPVVHGLPSSQALVLFENRQPIDVSQLSVVQPLPSSHTRGEPAHAPPEHVSPVVQAFPSLHASWLLENTHPVAESHESVVQTLLSPQTFGPPGWQAPAEQKSPTVHALPSLHTSAFAAWTHPVTVSQLSVVQPLPSSQFCRDPAWHDPKAQTSPTVQAFPSSQGCAFAANTHPIAVLQLSFVQSFASSQTAGVPPHVPPEHVSFAVQAFESEHGAALFV